MTSARTANVPPGTRGTPCHPAHPDVPARVSKALSLLGRFLPESSDEHQAPGGERQRHGPHPAPLPEHRHPRARVAELARLRQRMLRGVPGAPSCGPQPKHQHRGARKCDERAAAYGRACIGCKWRHHQVLDCHVLAPGRHQCIHMLTSQLRHGFALNAVGEEQKLRN